MSPKLPVNTFQWTEDICQFNKDFVKSYNEEGDEAYFLEVYIHNFEMLRELHYGLAFVPEIINIEKVKQLVANLHNKKKYVIRIKKSKQPLNHG